MTTRYISLVNLLAGEELFPEFLTDRCEAEAIAGHLQRWSGDAPAYEELCGRLTALRQKVAAPGACDRAAQYVYVLCRRRRPLDRLRLKSGGTAVPPGFEALFANSKPHPEIQQEIDPENAVVPVYQDAGGGEAPLRPEAADEGAAVAGTFKVAVQGRVISAGNVAAAVELAQVDVA